MATTASAVITLARRRHAALTPANTPQPVARELLGEVQRDLFRAALAVDPYLVAQSLPIFLALDATRVPGQPAGGPSVPGDNAMLGDYTGPGSSALNILNPAEAGAGQAVTPTLSSPDPGATRVVADTAGVASGTFAGVTWTPGNYADYQWAIVDGPGVGARGVVLNNTANGLTIKEPSWPLAVGSVVTLYGPSAANTHAGGVVTEQPAATGAIGYLVKLDATGTPVLDFDAPVTGTLEAGVRLPDYLRVLDGVVHFTDDSDPQPFVVVGRGQRFAKQPAFSGSLRGQQLFLHGPREDWARVRNLELQYVPVPPTPTADTSLLLVPDSAVDAASELLAAKLAERLLGLDIMPAAILADLRGTAASLLAQWLELVVGEAGSVRVLYMSDPNP